MQSDFIRVVNVKFTDEEFDNLDRLMRDEYPSTADVLALALKRDPFAGLREWNLDYFSEARDQARRDWQSQDGEIWLRDKLNACKTIEELNTWADGELSPEALKQAISDESLAPGSWLRVNEYEAFKTILENLDEYEAPELLEIMDKAQYEAEDELRHSWLYGDRSERGIIQEAERLLGASDISLDERTQSLQITWDDEDALREWLDVDGEDTTPEARYAEDATRVLLLQMASREAIKRAEARDKRRKDYEATRAYKASQAEAKRAKLLAEELEASKRAREA